MGSKAVWPREVSYPVAVGVAAAGRDLALSFVFTDLRSGVGVDTVARLVEDAGGLGR